MKTEETKSLFAIVCNAINPMQPLHQPPHAAASCNLYMQPQHAATLY